MTLAVDTCGLEALPLRLMIIAVVAGLSIVPAADALESLRDKSFLQRCELQLDAAIRTSQTMAVEGVGAVRTIQLDFRSEGRLRLASMTIGDGWGEPCMASMVLELTSGGRLVRTATEPVIWMASEDCQGLCVRAESFALRLTASQSGSVPMIVCEVLPWTS